jgi:hypothetical protein
VTYDPPLPGNNRGDLPAIGIYDCPKFFGIIPSYAAAAGQQFNGKRRDLPSLLGTKRGLGYFVLRGRPKWCLYLFHLRNKLISAPADRDNQARAFGVRLYLAAEADDLHVDAPVVRLRVLSG